MHFFNLFTPAQAKIIKKSQVDAALCGRSERSQNRTDATPCLSDVYNIGTRARRRLADVRLSGRSMVEMLGVLAIVGVLSVGAIAGYSKAMFKYKLNKQAEQLNTVFNAVTFYYKDFRDIASEVHKNLTPYFVQLGEIPIEMVKNNDTQYLYDVFDTRLWIRTSADTNSRLAVEIGLNMTDNTNQNLETCRNIITVAQQNSYAIHRVEARALAQSIFHRLWGDKDCTKGNLCLKDLTLEDVYTACTEYEDAEQSDIVVFWEV